MTKGMRAALYHEWAVAVRDRTPWVFAIGTAGIGLLSGWLYSGPDRSGFAVAAWAASAPIEAFDPLLVLLDFIDTKGVLKTEISNAFRFVRSSEEN